MPMVEALAPPQFHVVRFCWISGCTAIEILWCTACKVDLCLHLSYIDSTELKLFACAKLPVALFILYLLFKGNWATSKSTTFFSNFLKLCLDFGICRQYLGSQAQLGKSQVAFWHCVVPAVQWQGMAVPWEADPWLKQSTSSQGQELANRTHAED